MRVFGGGNFIGSFGRQPAPRGLSRQALRYTSARDEDDDAPMGEHKSFRLVRPGSRFSAWCLYAVDNRLATAITSLVTIYALTGDDLKHMYAPPSVDPTWDICILCAMAIFSCEIVLSIFGRDGYCNSFFFWLDVISTVTMLLDISTIDVLLGSGGDGGSMNDLRSGRTAKIGAKASKAIRVLRLVRILKLYKAYYDSRIRARRMEERRRLQAEGGQLDDLEDDWDDYDPEEMGQIDMQKLQESRVGKRLSERTTHRVVVLILSMMIVLPFLNPDDPMLHSPEYGCQEVHDAFNFYLQGLVDRAYYEDVLLNFIFYHNWYAQLTPRCADTTSSSTTFTCPNTYYTRLFWIGIAGFNETDVIHHATLAQLSHDKVYEMNAAAEVEQNLYSFGTMPKGALDILASPWATSCDDDQFYRGISLLDTSVDKLVAWTVTCPEQLRSSEILEIFPISLPYPLQERWHFVFFFDRRPYQFDSSMYSLLLTAFVMLLLVSGSLMFSYDANRLVVNPVEKMVKRVEAIRDSPLIAIQMADEEFRAEELAKARRGRPSFACTSKYLGARMQNCVSGSARGLMKCVPNATPETNETEILERTIIKLGSLLALGFGEAGANIIGHNMKGSDDGGVNAMIPGQRVECIIGVARVQNFSIATEVLQERIMTFVNQIAEIVHGVVNAHHGAPNKNSGETFLVVWRVNPSDTERTQRTADLSVISFARILHNVHSCRLLAQYREHPLLLIRLGRNFHVQLTFGLHLGWAIEGAVGSEFKIDASYVSPNVNIAASIERCTALYGVKIAMSHFVMDKCSQKLRMACRLIDRILIVGSLTKLELYTMDVHLESVLLPPEAPLNISWSSRIRFKVRQFLEQEKARKIDFEFDVVGDFLREMRALRRIYTEDFFQRFSMGFQNYIEGEWQVARRLLSSVRIRKDVVDGPSEAILRFMEEPNLFEAPDGWRGVRELSAADLSVV